jgi:uncharacterized membrane protein YccF (DUF307 family)
MIGSKEAAMSLLGNLLWITLGGGLFIFSQYFLVAVILAVTVVGIPAARQCMSLAVLSLFPFDKPIKPKPSRSGVVFILLKATWVLTAGLYIAMAHLIFAVPCAITIVGWSFAKLHVRLAWLALFPFGKEIRA